MAGKRITKSVESLKEVVGLVDSLGTSVDFLEERLRGVFVQLSNMGQLPPINFNKTTQGGQSAAPQFTAAPAPSAPIPQALSAYVDMAQHQPSQTKYNQVSPNFSFPPSVVHPNASMSSVFGPEISPAMREVRSRETERKQNAIAAPDPDQNLGSPFAKNKTEDLRRTFGTLNDTLIGTNNTLSRLATSLEDFAKVQKAKDTDIPKDQPASDNRQNQQPGTPSGTSRPSDDKEFSIFDRKNILGALGAVTGAINTYFKAETSTRSVNLGSQRLGEMARFGIAGTMQERALDSAMATDAGAMLRYQGDILLPGQTKYLGRGGFNNALDVAGKETDDRLKLEKAKHDGSVAMSWGAGIVAGVGVAGALGLSVATAPLALPAAIAIGGLTTLGGLFGSSNDTYSQLKDGGLANTFIGSAIYGSDNAKKIADETKSKARSELQKETYENTIGLQEAELRSNKRNEVAYATYLNSVKSRMANSVLIGGYSTGAYSDLNKEAQQKYQAAIDGQPASQLAPANTTGELFDYDKKGFPLSSPYSEKRIHPVSGKIEPHLANDYKAAAGIDVPAPFSGIITSIQKGPDNTKTLEMINDDGITAKLIHLAREGLPEKGQKVKMGDSIGKVAKHLSTDKHSNGNHVHLEVRKGNELLDYEKLLKNQAPATVESRKQDVDTAFSSIYSAPMDDFNKNYNIDMEQAFNYRARLLTVATPNVSTDLERTKGLLDLQQAGLGSFDTLVGNLGNLNQARGSNDNTGALREIMTSAVAAGFDRSRSAQQFVDSVTDLSGRLGVTDTNSLSSSLALSSKLLSSDITGYRADEKGLSKAKNAMESLASATSESDGMMGAVKAAVLARQGVRLSSGAAIYATMPTQQISSMISTLEGKKNLKDIKDVGNFDAEALLQVAEGKTAEEKRKWVVETLKKLRSSIGSVQDAAAKSIGDTSLSYGDLSKKMNGLNPVEQQAMLRAEAQKHGVSAAATGKIGVDGGALQYIQGFMESNPSFKIPGGTLQNAIGGGRLSATTGENAATSRASDTNANIGAVIAKAPPSIERLGQVIAGGGRIDYKGLHITNKTEFDEAVNTPKKKALIDEYRNQGSSQVAADARAYGGFTQDSTVKIDNKSINDLADAIVKSLGVVPPGSTPGSLSAAQNSKTPGTSSNPKQAKTSGDVINTPGINR